jgi:ABC-type cobalamin transport system permease subunit
MPTPRIISLIAVILMMPMAIRIAIISEDGLSGLALGFSIGAVLTFSVYYRTRK